VREWAIRNAELWIRDYRIDGLRLDAVHAVYDDSEEHVLAELRRRLPEALLISEMGPPDFRPIDEWGHDALWMDSLHHELHVALTGEQEGYYSEFDGRMSSIARELARPQGPAIVAAAQNHDQVGNRAIGDRLPPEKLRLAQAVVLFSRFTPLLFQGEEHAEPAPFQFFTDHIDPFIADATREGRKREFAHFAGFSGEVPDPQARETFERSKLTWREDGAHRAFVRELIAARRDLPDELAVEADDAARTLTLRRGGATLHVDFANERAELSR
jgi:maltooligosyltrehalose trehalohydrolase